MNCPGGMLVYKSQSRSYRDLPLRIGELGLVHRHEKSGQLHGLMRVRCFTQDDAHIFMTQEQITEEIKNVTRLINEVYTLFGFEYFVELSTRPEDSMGSDEDWELATNGLRNALEEMGLDYIVNEGDGAFYGPKIDFHLRDSIGRTCPIQISPKCMKRTPCDNRRNISLKQSMALLCKKSRNAKCSKRKNIITANLEEGKYIWLLDKLQDSISKTDSNTGSNTIPVSNQYNEQHTAKSNTSTPRQSKNLQIRSNKSKRHCHSTEHKLPCSKLLFL